jgi:hypothetical protein
MDGSDPLVASPLATWSVQLLDFYPANLRAHEIPGSLPPVLLGWTAQILSWLRHSRLRASNFWTSTPRTSELTRSLDLCHLSSSDGRLRSSRGFATRDLEHPTFGLLPCEPPSSRDPLDLCHLSSSDGRLRSSRGFATRDLEHPTFGSYLANLRVHETLGSLPPVLLGEILSWLRHSRLRASLFTRLNPRLSPYRSNDCRVS